jgi:hypothetical protein
VLLSVVAAASAWLLSSAGCSAPPNPTPANPPGELDELSIVEDYDKGEDLGEIAKDFALVQELDVYDFARLHELVRLAASRGIVLRPYIGCTPVSVARATEYAIDGAPKAAFELGDGTLERLALEPDAVRWFEIPAP